MVATVGALQVSLSTDTAQFFGGMSAAEKKLQLFGSTADKVARQSGATTSALLKDVAGRAEGAASSVGLLGVGLKTLGPKNSPTKRELCVRPPKMPALPSRSSNCSTASARRSG
jgi:hypothetical protein